ncbi:KipI antagonist [Lacunisphaera limnophila]|uniref:KipI antagonist n=1 Tax=Lacunisphaera limnophila TaxID=1838286 RepID=A0A1D8AZD2_9BACT|nr:biotin-dependent carboxyltransferase family protein [Lacunisphaera limnophila]AOS46237.1 KipI antagonist [Lacunisphaera limnophila]
MIRVLKPGLLTTVQDLGRPGYQQYGVAVGGALDAFAARVANLVVGNDENAALIEIAQTGPELQFERETLVAWNGGDFEPTIGGEPLPRDRAVRVAAGEKLVFGVARAGLRAWLAVAGGIDVPLVMGSRSTYRRAGIGGHEGRPLAAGDVLPCYGPGERSAAVLASLKVRGQRGTVWTVRPETLGQPAPAGVVRAMCGPEWDWFAAEAQKAFFASAWEATREADRMGVRLHGPELLLAPPREMISAAVNTGLVQVPPSGQPIVLLPSRQSVGGYPRIAAVAAVDIGRFTQLRPGEKVTFSRIPLVVALDLQLKRERDLTRVRLGLARLAG